MEVILDEELVLRKWYKVHFHKNWHVGINNVSLKDFETLATLVVCEALRQVWGSDSLNYSIAKVNNALAGENGLFWDVLHTGWFLNGRPSRTCPWRFNSASAATSIAIDDIAIITLSLIFDSVSAFFIASINLLTRNVQFLDFVAYSTLLACKDLITNDAVVCALLAWTAGFSRAL